jgi:hypothetical protein
MTNEYHCYYESVQTDHCVPCPPIAFVNDFLVRLTKNSLAFSFHLWRLILSLEIVDNFAPHLYQPDFGLTKKLSAC